MSTRAPFVTTVASVAVFLILTISLADADAPAYATNEILVKFTASANVAEIIGFQHPKPVLAQNLANGTRFETLF